MIAPGANPSGQVVLPALDTLLQRLDGVQPTGKGYRARCPACGGKSRKLSVTEGDEGNVLLHCFGCGDAAAVLQAVGLTLADLFPTRLRPRTPEERRQARRMARQSQWGAALEMLDFEALVVQIAARQMLEREPLAPHDYERVVLASSRITDARAVLNAR